MAFAISWLSWPSAALVMICARITWRCGRLRLLFHASKVSRSDSLSEIVWAFLLISRMSIHENSLYVNIIVTHYTSSRSMNKVAKRIVVWGALVMAVALFGACPPNGLLTDLQDKVRNPLKSAIGSGNR